MKAFTLFLLLITLSSCHQSKLIIQKLDRYPMKSTLFAEIELDKKELTSLLNTKIDEALQNDFSKSNVTVHVTRTGDVTMMLKDEKLRYSLPIDIQANMSAYVKVSGELQLWFESEYHFNPDWALHTHTEPAGFQWIKEPNAKILGIQIPIEKLSNLAINQVSPTLAETIDDQMNALSNFGPILQTLMDSISKPILVDTAHNLWLTGTPNRFGLSPLFDNGDKFYSNIFSSVSFQLYPKKPDQAAIQLPKLEFEPMKKQKTQIHINGIFSADSLANILKDEMVGMEFPFAGKTIKIEDIEIDFAGRLLRSRIKVSGAINGYIDGSGAPYINPNHSKLMIDDFDVKLTGSNMLMRSSMKLFRKKIKEVLVQSINEQIQTLSKDAIDQIKKDYTSYGINSIISLRIVPDNKINFNFEIKQGSLYLQISLNGIVQLKIKNNG